MKRQRGDETLSPSALLLAGLVGLIAVTAVQAQPYPPDDPTTGLDDLLEQWSEIWLRLADEQAAQQYAAEGAEITPWLKAAALPGPDNAALVYYQAFLARPERDDATDASFDDVLDGKEPDGKIRIYLGKCRETIRLAEMAGQMSPCTWGLWRPDGTDASMQVLRETRQLAFVLAADARTLAWDGHGRTALARCLVIRQLARHIGDDTLVMFLVSLSIDTFAHGTMQDVLGILPAQAESLRWLRGQLAAIDGIPRSLAKVFQKDFELAVDLMRGDTTQLARIRELWPAETASMTDEEIVARARQLRQPFQNGMQAVLDGDMPFELQQAEIEKLATELEAQYTGDGLDRDLYLWAAAPPAQILRVHDLFTRSLAYADAIKIAAAIYLEFAETRRLPETLPEHMPKDPFSGRDFEYEITANGFRLRRHVVDPNQDKLWEYEFTVRD